jgi:hypothetical protein
MLTKSEYIASDGSSWLRFIFKKNSYAALDGVKDECDMLTKSEYTA